MSDWKVNGTNDIIRNKLPNIVVNPSGQVYQTGTSISKFFKFSTGGSLLHSWGTDGEGDGQFSLPTGIATDKSGNLFIIDSANYRIQKFDGNDKFLTKWGTQGTGDGQFKNPTGIAVDSSGNVFVSDEVNSNIQKFDNNGKFITKWGTQGTGDGQFKNPAGIAVDAKSGIVYVADTGNSRIKLFKSVKSPTIKKVIEITSPATTIIHISITEIAKWKFGLPALIEQKQITSVIKLFDTYLNQKILLKKKIYLIKKGLMQQLLTGKIRVKV